MSEQLALLNSIDLSPMVPVQPVAPVVAAPEPEPKQDFDICLMDCVHILPWTDDKGFAHGAYYGVGVVVGFNSVGMVMVDIGIPCHPYPCSPWRIVRIDD